MPKKRPATKKSTAEKKATVSKHHTPKSVLLAMADGVKRGFGGVRARQTNFLRRRPHRSFQLTKRRDYARSLKLPGYIAFTIEVSQTLWRRKATFVGLGLIFLLLTIAFGLLGSQDLYSQLAELMSSTAPEGLYEGITGEVSKAGLMLLSIASAGLTTELSEGQLIAAALFGLYLWMTVVWLLRNIMAGKKVNIRDGVYTAGAPLVSTLLMFLVLLIQLVPGSLAVIIVTAGLQSGFISEGVASMAAGLGLALIVVASLYWVVSTLIALVVITLPGMYPFRALAIAGDLVVGRRLRLLYRMLWLAFTVVSWWVVIMIPVILLDSLLKSWIEQIAWIPIVPVATLVMTTFTIIWTSSYIYLLYRKVVDDDASPA